MQIIHIIPNLSKGGAERLVLDICEELSKRRDVQVLLITFSDENQYPEFTMNFPWKVVSAEMSLSIWKPNKINVSSLQKIIDDFKPDVIHSHLFYAEMLSRFCHYPSAKWFSHGHDNMVQFENFSIKMLFNKQKLTNYFEKSILFKNYRQKGNHFIAISNNSYQYLKNTAHNYPITLLHNAINYPKFYRPKSIKADQRLNLVNVGSLVKKKNQVFLLDLAVILKDKNIDFVLHLLGDGPNFPLLQDKIKSLQLSDSVILHGNVSNVEEFYWNADFYVHSATYEPLGLVLLEAMAAGLPVITLDGLGNRDIIEQGKNGWMFKEQNAVLFADTLIELRNNPIKYLEISTFAQDYAANYDIKKYIDDLLKVYEREKSER